MCLSNLRDKNSGVLTAAQAERETTAALYLHRSTLLDRLAHITQIFGCDLKNPDFCLTLGILLRAELQQKRITQPKP